MQNVAGVRRALSLALEKADGSCDDFKKVFICLNRAALIRRCSNGNHYRDSNTESTMIGTTLYPGELELELARRYDFDLDMQSRIL